jgi:hypothetical protein
LKPQAFAVQVRTPHSVSLPGQSLALLQPTQTPVLSHTWLPPHEVPLATGGFDGTPLVHTSPVQGFESSGTSALSLADTTLPAPSH